MNAHHFTPTAGSKSACEICGKTRNVKAHKDAKALDAVVDARTEAEMAAEAEADAQVAEDQIAEEEAVAAARQDMLPEVSDATDDSEIADALAALELQDEAPAETYGVTAANNTTPQSSRYADKPAETAEKELTAEDVVDAKSALKAIKQQAAKKANGKKAPKDTIRLWVGWRISNAAVLRKDTPAQRSLAAKLREAKPNSEMDRFVHLTVDELKALDEVGVTFAAEGNTGPVVYSARTMRRRIGEALAKLEAQA